MFPVLIVGGLYGGWFSPTEVAAIAVLYAFILEVFIHRAVKLSEIPDIAYSTGLITRHRLHPRHRGPAIV